MREYKEIEGIELDRENICKRPGKRSLGKIMLNSFYCKWAQRSNLSQTEVVKDRKRLLQLLFSPEKKVTGIIPINQEIIYVSWCLKEEADISAPFTNVAIAIFITAQARLYLYEYLEKVNHRSIYFDTDSILFINTVNPQEYTPPLGNMLGCMTNELECYGPSAYITSFVSTGPKSYTFLVYDLDSKETSEVCKVKGITLNFENLKNQLREHKKNVAKLVFR